MDNTNKRVKEVRLTFEKSQEDFGNELGITKGSVSRIESGSIGLTNQMAKLICKVFNVDYFWLTEGKGEPFTSFPETVIDEVVDQYRLDKADKAILQAYVNLPDLDRKAIKNFLLSIAENVKEESD